MPEDPNKNQMPLYQNQYGMQMPPQQLPPQAAPAAAPAGGSGPQTAPAALRISLSKLVMI